ncbi:Arc family DNA-binding protein [Aeromonas salmonicida]|uniref:Arc family DNA-binding protein n=1 Tax=Aeromonas salmonicida TaxID=645 RepID=UPI001F3F3AB3|nr:Arc family DNA-binding protein [Aeromonas salmonicida]MCE9932401.1 Arc family DNA-binding protein [Aeromonas salmonicida]
MREYPSFCLRMPPEVKSAIKESAKNTGRTMNSEIVQRLKEMLKNEGKLADAINSSTQAASTARAEDVNPTTK